MLDLEHDMQAVFYGPDFALQLKRVRPGVEDLQFQGIVGMTDREALEGHATATSRTQIGVLLSAKVWPVHASRSVRPICSPIAVAAYFGTAFPMRSRHA